MKRLFFLPLLVACSTPPTPPSAEASRTTAQAIQGGQPDTDPSNAFAIAIILPQGLCSGTLIAPNLAITARHCVESQVSQSGDNCENGPLASPSDLMVSTSQALDFGGGMPTGTYAVSKILPMPEVSAGCNPDVSLVELAQPVPSSVAKPATPAVQPSFVSRPHFSDKVTAIGFGVDDSGQPGERRIKENISVLCVPGDDQFPCGGVEQGADYEIVADRGPCEGDSGGGLYDQASFDAKAPVIVATVSRGPVDSQGICGPGVFVRVDKFKDFIITSALQAAKDGSYTPPVWTSATEIVDAGTDAAVKPPPSDTPADSGAPSAAPATTTTTTSGCSTTRAPMNGSSAPFAGAAALAALLIARGCSRRRRR